MLKMCLSGCSFCALLWYSILFPEDAKYWMPGIIPFNKCVCDFYHIQAVCSVFVDMKDHQMVQSAAKMVERRYVLTCFMVENDRSLTALAVGIFASTVTWGTKVFVVALNDCTNSTSSFALSIVDSGKYLRVSSCVFN